MKGVVEKPRILCLAGGTGGHIFPALAVLEQLKDEGWEAFWLGSKNGMEVNIVPKHDIPLSVLKIGGLRGKSFASLLLAPIKLVVALWAALRLIIELKPTVVLGMGGFASGPGGLAAFLTRTPLIIHEQNAIPGLTNRLLASLADVVLEAFPGAFTGRKNSQCTGNPLRKSILNLWGREKVKSDSAPLHVLLIGGSRGALALNELLPEVCTHLELGQFEIKHQSGAGKLEGCRRAYEAAGIDLSTAAIEVCEFIDDMDSAYQWADIVICRAGALTVSELAVAGLPAIMVPYPFAVDDHQTANAKFLVDQGAGFIFQQHELHAENVAQLLTKLAADPKQLSDLAQGARRAAKPEATQAVCAVCHSFIEGDALASKNNNC